MNYALICASAVARMITECRSFCHQTRRHLGIGSQMNWRQFILNSKRAKNKTKNVTSLFAAHVCLSEENINLIMGLPLMHFSFDLLGKEVMEGHTSHGRSNQLKTADSQVIQGLYIISVLTAKCVSRIQLPITWKMIFLRGWLFTHCVLSSISISIKIPVICKQLSVRSLNITARIRQTVLGIIYDPLYENESHVAQSTST